MNDETISSVINRPLPNTVTYDLSTPSQVHTTLPESSIWSIGLHWHDTHIEWLCLIKGSIWVQFGDKKETFNVKDGEKMEVQVPRYMWHEWGRATTDGEDVKVIERTDPADGVSTFLKSDDALKTGSATLSNGTGSVTTPASGHVILYTKGGDGVVHTITAVGVKAGSGSGKSEATESDSNTVGTTSADSTNRTESSSRSSAAASTVNGFSVFIVALVLVFAVS